MGNFINKNMLTLSFFFSFGLITAMEEKRSALEEDLPAEMNLYITQFLGSNLAETLKNIALLSQVDKYFYTLITANPKLIGHALRSRFENERLEILNDAAKIDEESSAAVVSNKLNVIKNFLTRDIVNISEVFDAAIVNQNFVILDYLLNNFLNDIPSIFIDQRGLVTPLDFVMSHDLIGTGSPERFAREIIERGANVNQLVSNKRVTPLYLAMQLNDTDLFAWLLEKGANPAMNNQDGTSVLQYIKENPDLDGGVFKWLLEEVGGFKIALRINNKRGRTFTVQRKKIQHRNRSVVRNSRKYNHQSI